jgi:hypothetical protein
MPLEEPQARSWARGVMGIVTVLLVFGVLIAFVVKGCTTPETTGWLGTAAPSSTTAHTPPWFGDMVSAWGVELGISGPAWYDNYSTTLAVGDGNEALVMIANINNTGNEAFIYLLACWEGRDAANRVYHATVHFPDSALTDGIVRPGETASGYIGFELPKGTYLASVTYRPIGVGLDPEYVRWEGRY